MSFADYFNISSGAGKFKISSEEDKFKILSKTSKFEILSNADKIEILSNADKIEILSNADKIEKRNVVKTILIFQVVLTRLKEVKWHRLIGVGRFREVNRLTLEGC